MFENIQRRVVQDQRSWPSPQRIEIILKRKLRKSRRSFRF